MVGSNFLYCRLFNMNRIDGQKNNSIIINILKVTLEYEILLMCLSTILTKNWKKGLQTSKRVKWNIKKDSQSIKFPFQIFFLFIYLKFTFKFPILTVVKFWVLCLIFYNICFIFEQSSVYLSYNFNRKK